VYIVTQNLYSVECQLVTDIGLTVGDSSVHSDTELIYGKMPVSDRHWTDSRRQQCI